MKTTFVRSHVATMKCEVLALADNHLRQGYAVNTATGQIYAVVKPEKEPLLVKEF